LNDKIRKIYEGFSILCPCFTWGNSFTTSIDHFALALSREISFAAKSDSSPERSKPDAKMSVSVSRVLADFCQDFD